MLKVTVSNLDGISLPAKEGDVGYDLIAATDPLIVGTKTDEYSIYYSSIDYIEYEVDLKIAPPEGVWSMVFPRSSISTKNLSLCNSVGVVDNGYRGKIKVRFNYVIQPEDLLIFSTELSPLATEVNYEKIYKKGDKIAQLVFCESVLPALAVGDVGETERSDSGFGSTDFEGQKIYIPSGEDKWIPFAFTGFSTGINSHEINSEVFYPNNEN